jgi:hypothetical protein
MLKYLRIAATALSLTACLLLIALWVRSYWWADMIRIQTARTRLVSLSSVRASLIVHTSRQSEASFSQPGGLGYAKRLASGVKFDGEHGATIYDLVRFGFAMGNRRFSLTVPHWVPVLVTGILAAVIWHKQSWRFNIRTLLIVTTVVAIGLGIVMVAMYDQH